MRSYDNIVTIQIKDYVSIPEAAEILGITRQAVRYKTKQQKLALYIVSDSIYLLKRNQVKAYKDGKISDRMDACKISKYVSIAEAAEILKVNKTAVWDALQRRCFPLYSAGKLNMVLKEDIEEYKNSEQRLKKAHIPKG